MPHCGPAPSGVKCPSAAAPSMKSTVARICAASLALAAVARAGEPPIISKARAYLGTEAALENVKSVHMEGRITGTAGDPSRQLHISVEIVFQKPFQESIVTVQRGLVVHTALDNYEAWVERQDGAGPDRKAIDPRRPRRLAMLGTDQLKVLRVDTLENLWFYRGAQRIGGRIEDEGPAVVDGIDCEKVVFTYSPATVYTRYFDRSTGRLVYSESEGGAKIREQGEIVASGVRYPKSIVVETAGGSPATKTYTFDRITLNEDFSPDLFAVPAMPPPAASEAPASPKP